MNPLAMIAEMKRVDAKILKLRSESWKNVEQTLGKLLDADGIAENDDTRQILLAIVRESWHKGYYAGTCDVSILLADEMGMKDLVPVLQEAKTPTPPVRPQNN
jgi:hypothetical protein